MGLVLVRIDDRLIHGQIIEGWVRYLHVNHIVVSNNQVGNDEMQKVLMTMAVPPPLKVDIFTLSETIEELKFGTFDKSRVLILVSSPSDALFLTDRGLCVSKINVGGIHYSVGKKQVLKTISVNDDDIASFYCLHEKGIKLEVQVVPTDEGIDIMKYIKRDSDNN